MKLKISTLAVALALGMATGTSAGVLSKDELKREHDRISARYKTDRQVCDSRSGNAKDICMAEAKGNENVAKAELEARDKGTAKARQDSRVAKATADYDVAKERCDDFAGNAKDVCRKDAQAIFTKAKADATLDRKTTEAKASANEKISDARVDANKTKREADYKAARERCDSMAGTAKDNCVNQARTAYGM